MREKDLLRRFIAVEWKRHKTTIVYEMSMQDVIVLNRLVY